MTNPFIPYHSSIIPTNVGDLRTHHLQDLKALLRLDNKTVPTLYFTTPATAGLLSLEATSDAAISLSYEGAGVAQSLFPAGWGILFTQSTGPVYRVKTSPTLP